MFGFLKRLFGASSSPSPARPRQTARLQLEQLDQRLVPSTTGVISQVVDGHGNSVAFYIGTDRNLYASANGGWAVQLDSAGIDNAVSAGIDSNGNAAAFVRNIYNNSLWDLHTWVNGRSIGLNGYDTFIDSGVTSFSAVMGKNVANGEKGGVYYLNGGSPVLYQDSGWQVLPGGGQFISAGTDQSGNAVAYVRSLASYSSDLYEVTPTGYEIWIAGGVYGQVAGSVNGIVYYQDSYDNAVMVNTSNGASRIVARDVVQMESGTDFWGNSTLDVTYSGWNEVDQFNAGSNSTTMLVQQGTSGYWCAGQGGHDYYQGFPNNLHDLDNYWAFYYSGGSWHFQHFESDNVIGYNVY
jgi:hypothetical protein